MTSTAPLRQATGKPGPVRGPVRRSKASARLRRRNQRVEAYRELVRPLALHYARRCQESVEDLEQVGLLGLIRAAELFRSELGTPFPAFARPHIRGAILHYLRDEAPCVRLPRRQAELQERLLRLEGDLTSSDLGMGPGGLRQHLGIDEEHWGLLLRHRQLCRPLPLEEARLEELAAPPNGQVEERVVALRQLLEELDPRQQQVVRQVVLAGWSYRRLAAQMQVSPMTVQRLLHRGLASLREQLDARELRRGLPACRAGSEPRGC
jgi:RNA polymerase sigma-B factor